jgi:hypothetical protein
VEGEADSLWLVLLHNLRWAQETPAIRFTWNPDQPRRSEGDPYTTIGFDEPASLRRRFPQFLPLERFGSTLPCDVFLESTFAIDLLTESVVDKSSTRNDTARQNVGEVAKLWTERTCGWTWQEAQQKADTWVRRHGYPGLLKLGRAMGGCPAATLSKAIKKSKFLSAQKAEHERGSRGHEVQLSQEDLDGRPQTKEPDPLQSLIREQEADARRDCQRARPRTNAFNREH